MSAIPCHLLVFPLINDGTHNIIITKKAIGTSKISDALIPLIILEVGILKGPKVDAIPVTKTILKKLKPARQLLPTIFLQNLAKKILTNTISSLLSTENLTSSQPCRLYRVLKQ